MEDNNTREHCPPLMTWAAHGPDPACKNLMSDPQRTLIVCLLTLHQYLVCLHAAVCETNSPSDFWEVNESGIIS